MNFNNGLRETIEWYLKNKLFVKQISKKNIIKDQDYNMIKKGIILAGGLGTR